MQFQTTGGAKIALPDEVRWVAGSVDTDRNGVITAAEVSAAEPERQRRLWQALKGEHDWRLGMLVATKERDSALFLLGLVSGLMTVFSAPAIGGPLLGGAFGIRARHQLVSNIMERYRIAANEIGRLPAINKTIEDNGHTHPAM
ncbi:MAG: hypothetical protein IT384_26150 [Deltaproteobacteria bacterium]|nr:hypothetical protein [Deltaproteobacteria bacterium]